MSQQIIKLLRSTADEQFETTSRLLKQMSEEQLTVLFIEVCRAFDFWMVQNTFGGERAIKLSEPELNILTRGWNSFLEIVLPRIGSINGVPLLESTGGSIRAATAELHKLGTPILLNRAADMLELGVLSAKQSGEKLTVWMENSGDGDLFLDQLEDEMLDNVDNLMRPTSPQINAEALTPTELQAELDAAVFPWRTGRGTMVGYNSTPAMDEHFIAISMPILTKLRDKAGFHPDARINGVRASDLTAIVALLMSAKLKHIHLVSSGRKQWPEVNTYMSLSIWKPKNEIIDDMSEFTGMDRILVAIIIDMLTLTDKSKPDLSSDVDPVIPFFIKFTDNYLIEPTSAVFINPFDTVKRLQNKPENQTSLRMQREDWMRSDLNALFQGTRYKRLETRAKLKLNGKILTDIDGAILDTITNELCLFQFKWQDYTGATMKQITSRAKNFVSEIQDWEHKILKYLSEKGTDMLLRSLRFSKVASNEEIKVKLVAVGRAASRFSDLGYSNKTETVATCTWSQFIRLRAQIGPAENVITELHSQIRNETTGKVKLLPIPYEIKMKDICILFENLWNTRELY
ncbi:hypothetical protein [Lentilitoribacter sp. EG35]|uniref:hypothetical protein n=1 Tax=Lentilitoribacter sp. EG35 TaxID=3234192 RepID=UPI00346105FA